MAKLRLALAAIFLALVVAVDFTSRVLSVVADGILIAVVVVAVWPLLSKKKN